IRTPMNGIIGFTNAALGLARDPDLRDCLTDVKRCADSLLRLLNDILDLSRMESGKMELSREPFDLKREIEDALQSMEPAARIKRLELRSALAMDGHTVDGDRRRLRQVLINLVGNAIKFTSEGSIHVQVTTEPAGPERIRCFFRVAD